MEQFYNYCPTATILNFNNKKIFVCHGGIPLAKLEQRDVLPLQTMGAFI